MLENGYIQHMLSILITEWTGKGLSAIVVLKNVMDFFLQKCQVEPLIYIRQNIVVMIA